MEIFESIWNTLVFFFWAFVFIAALIALILVLTDLIRDKSLNGWAKAVWILFLVFIPLLTSMIYIIARGRSMPDRINDDARRRRDAVDDYIREVATISPADEIAKAKALLDAGTVTTEEFEALKARVVTGSVTV